MTPMEQFLAEIKEDRERLAAGLERLENGKDTLWFQTPGSPRTEISADIAAHLHRAIAELDEILARRGDV